MYIKRDKGIDKYIKGYEETSDISRIGLSPPLTTVKALRHIL